MREDDHIKDFLRRELEEKFLEKQTSTILKNSKKDQFVHRKGKLIKQETKELKELKVNNISEEKIACINLAYANGELIKALI